MGDVPVTGEPAAGSGARNTIAAGLLQATSLPFVVADVAVGQELGVLSAATGAALIAAGLARVLLFPSAALAVLHGAPAAVTPPVPVGSGQPHEIEGEKP